MQKAVIIIYRVKGVEEVRLTLTPLTLNKNKYPADETCQS